MLSFKALSEKKTKITLNPKLKDVMEKKGCPKCQDTCGEDCKCSCHDKEKTPAQKSVEGKGGMTEAKKKDDTYLETDFKKRQKNNEKARKDLMKGPQMKNPHFESTEENAYVSQEEVSEESTKESETETFLTFKQFNESRAEDAKKSLDAVKKRQAVLDAHEKKTGKKLDITKTPEHKAHKQNFPGAKRTGKKVKGQKETPQETQNRRINKATERIVKKGYTSKEKKEVKAMAKHASRFD
jgi:hypothetical protein